MRFLRLGLIGLGLSLSLAACQTNDLAEPPAPLGDFSLGLNVVVTDEMQKLAISRDATGPEWEAALEKAIDDRFGRYQGAKLYNIGLAVDAFALAPPGIPLVMSPKSALAVTVHVWDDAAKKKLNEKGKQLVVTEKLSEDTVLGSGLSKTREKQMETLAYNTAKALETWLLENPEWFGLPSLPTAAVPAATVAAEAKQ
jgi:hypothetical protein